jgi:hypothetical protein
MVRVTLDIFSGRPNPSWVLDEREAREVLRQVAAAREAATPADQDRGVLGFRGLVIESDEGPGAAAGLDLPASFRIASGQSGNEGKGLELAERLISRMGRVFPATGAPSDEGAFAGLDLRSLALGELRSVPTSGGEAGTLSDAAPGDATAQAGATVIGTDASSWTTLTVGSCSYEASAFNPNFWNAVRTVMRNNNCYNYASNRRTDTFGQPGRATGAQATTMACSNVTAGAVSDGAVQASTCVGSGSPRHYMALVIWPGTDYHWYRRHSDGFWGHKPGQTAARNYDNSNNVIYDPQTANRGGYTSFCGYFFGPAGMQVL